MTFHPLASIGAAIISPPPRDGVNLWCMSAARRCQLAGYSDAQTTEAIMTAARGKLRPGRTLSQAEVLRAIQTANGTAHHAGASAPKIKPMPRAELAKLCPPLTEAAAQAFVKTSPANRLMPSAEVLGTLFRPEEFIALKTVNNRQAKRWRVARLPDIFKHATEPFQFVTSSPLTGRAGRTQSGNRSPVALECFTAQRYVVIEFDTATPPEQFARILWLRERLGDHAPLVMMLKSGGRSFHAWFKPVSPEIAAQLKAAGVKLGADPAAMQIHQPVRCPNQLRKAEPGEAPKLQELLWLSPPSL